MEVTRVKSNLSRCKAFFAIFSRCVAIFYIVILDILFMPDVISKTQDYISLGVNSAQQFIANTVPLAFWFGAVYIVIRLGYSAFKIAMKEL